MNIKPFLEWAMIAVVILSFLVWMGYRQPANADDYDDYGYDSGYSLDDDPEYWSDIRNPPEMIIYQNRGHGRYRSREPEYWSDIQNPPQMIIYPGRRYMSP